MADYIEIPPEYWPEPDELPADLRRIAVEVERVWPGNGIKCALIIGQLFAGIPIYPANIAKFLRKLRNTAIRQDYDTGNICAKDLALKYRLSQRQIEKILAVVEDSQPADKQLKLFD